MISKNFPEGNFTVTPSEECEKTIADDPAALINFPPSPAFFSILQIKVPSGIDSNDNIFFGVAGVPTPVLIVPPTEVPSGAGI